LDSKIMNSLSFGVSLTPTHDLPRIDRIVEEADRCGLDFVGLQDHPYVAGHLDALTLAARLLSRTEQLSVFPDVANLPLRPPAVLAKTAASLNFMSGGRFRLGIGAGGYWDAIAAMGAPRRNSAQALAALEEAISLMRSLWQQGEPVRHDGEYYRVQGIEGSDTGDRGVEIWIGAQGPRSFELTGRVADGWAAPIPSYLPYERWSDANRAIDRAAQDHGRDPRAVTRIAQVVGTIDEESRSSRLTLDTGQAPLRGSAQEWIDALSRLGTSQPFTSFIFWPENEELEQVQRFINDVAPVVRRNLS
jgi:alkanesulfonate monooxygenase SsuD/methylene tetrahydromethanopterin reductase-like flavin-dependent oxidoreductase (luciferase family)